MEQRRDVPTPYVRKVIPLCEWAPLTVLGGASLVGLAGFTMGGHALALVALGMWAANLLRDWCLWYSARHPDEP
jgi:hypothetical protein